MHEEIRGFRRSCGLRTGCYADGGRRCNRLLRNIRRCNGRQWRLGTIFLDHSNWTHDGSSEGHAAPRIEIDHGGGARGSFDGRGECCLCRPTTNRKSRCVNFRWRWQHGRCLRSSAINSTRYLSGAKSQGLARVVRYLHRRGSGRNGVGQNDRTADGLPQKSATDSDATNKQQETYVETRGHRELDL
jgi:hypothetical protein